MTNTELIRQEIERRIGAMYNFSSGYSALNVCRELLDFIDNLPEEQPEVDLEEDEGTICPQKGITTEDAMAKLDEKIKSAKKSWEGVDVDKYMDEVRGRDETVTDCDKLEEEIDRAIDDLEGVAEKDADGVLIAHLTLIEHLKDFARHFAEWGAEHRDRFLNWIRDLIKAGIEKPEEALNILKRIDTLINDNSLWAEHLKK